MNKLVLINTEETIIMKKDYSWSQDLQDWEKRQEDYERLELNTDAEINDEWIDGIPPEIQELIDWYKND